MSKKPTGLPEVEDETQLAKQRSDEFQKAQICTKCDQPGRVVSNCNGINVFCDRCKWHWPISAVPLVTEALPIEERGLSKRTLVEPDWSRALEDD